MNIWKTLLNLIGGNKVEIEEEGSARRVRLSIAATLAAGVAAALFGLAAGSADPSLAINNVYKVPMVILLSAVAALPAGLLSWKLIDVDMRLSDVMTSLISANYTGTLVLLAAAPLVALYYLTGSAFGGHLGLGATLVATAVTIGVFFRAALLRRPEDVSKRQLFVPLAVTGAIQLVALVQLIGIASPILPEVTAVSHGMDGLLNF
jgi:hypothetical protein